MKKIVLILPYYGKLPWYFNFFLKSLDGKSFDVLFVSDILPKEYPENFKILSMSLKNFEELLNKKLQTNIFISNTYKLCDFKPMYGKIFEDYICNYDYWAFGDCDLIYGKQLNDVLSQRLADEPDIVSFRDKWISGSFTLMKNVPKINHLYLRSKSLDFVYSNTAYSYFDELGEQWFDKIESGEMTIRDAENYRDSFTAIVWRSQDVFSVHENIVCEEFVKDNWVTMKKGRLVINGKEIPLFHYINAKHLGHFFGKTVSYTEIGDYYVNYTGFYLSNLAWRMRGIISRYRNVTVHIGWYYDMLAKRGWRVLIEHFYQKVIGRKR